MESLRSLFRPRIRTLADIRNTAASVHVERAEIPGMFWAHAKADDGSHDGYLLRGELDDPAAVIIDRVD